MKQLVVCIIFSWITVSVSAQQWAFEYWHDGRIVLESGDTLRGQVKYDLQQDVIQFTDQKSVIEAFTARKVLFCEIFDKTISQYRQFYSLPYNATSGYRTPMFFELLTEGKLTLLCRERLENQTTSASYSPYYYGGTYSRTILVNKFYLLKENGDIVDFSTKRSDFEAVMGKHEETVTGFMKDNKLKLDSRDPVVNKSHLTQIIAYYNSLFKTKK